MDTIKIIIKGVAPLSTNETKSFNRNGQYYKNTKKDKFQKEIDLQCFEYADKMAEFKRNFDKKNEFLSVFYQIRFPEHKFYNKNGTLKQKRLDIDNAFKCFQDRIFKNLGIDDVFICDLVSDIRPSDDFKIITTITKLTRDF